jgi:flagella basal body P-ring formation protein FlgA
MNAPEPGKTTEFSITSIAYALQQYPDMNSVLLRGQMQMTIERKVQTLSLDAITKLIADYIDSSENFAELESLKISISENMETPQIFSVEQCKLTGFERLNETNEYSFTLSYPVDAETTNTMAVKATIRQLRKAWVAKTPLNRGHILQAGDLALQPIQNETETNYLNADDPFAGMELSRSLRQNEPVNKNYLLEVICASKGDIVNIRASRGLLDITLKAKALTPGRKGDRIVCINEQSKKRINVTMVAPKEARLDI